MGVMTVLYRAAMSYARDHRPYREDFSREELGNTVASMLRNGHAVWLDADDGQRLELTQAGRVFLARYVPCEKTRQAVQYEMERRGWAVPPPAVTRRVSNRNLLGEARTLWPVGKRVVGHTIYGAPVGGMVLDHRMVERRPCVVLRVDRRNTTAVPIDDILAGTPLGRRARLELSVSQRGT